MVIKRLEKRDLEGDVWGASLVDKVNEIIDAVNALQTGRTGDPQIEDLTGRVASLEKAFATTVLDGAGLTQQEVKRIVYDEVAASISCQRCGHLDQEKFCGDNMCPFKAKVVQALKRVM